MHQGDTAVVMIDVQNMYIASDGMRDALGWPPIWRLHEVVAECAELLTEARAQGIPIIFSRAVGSQAGVLGANPRFQRLAASLAGRLPEVSAEAESWSAQIMDAVAPQPGDLVIEKTRPSFFEYTEFEPVLRNLGVTRLIVAGLQTNVCVEARFARGSRTISRWQFRMTRSAPTVRSCTSQRSIRCACSTRRSLHGAN